MKTANQMDEFELGLWPYSKSLKLPCDLCFLWPSESPVSRVFQWSSLMAVSVCTAKEQTLSSTSDSPPTPNTRILPRLLWMWVHTPFYSFVAQNSHFVMEGNTVWFLSFSLSPTRPSEHCACVTKTSVQVNLKPGPGDTKRPSWPWWTEKLPLTKCTNRLRATWWWVENDTTFVWLINWR